MIIGSHLRFKIVSMNNKHKFVKTLVVVYFVVYSSQNDFNDCKYISECKQTQTLT